MWSRARSFAEEAIAGAVVDDQRRQSETAKRSKELGAEASNHIKAEALKRADQIKSISLLDPSLPLPLPASLSLSSLTENRKQLEPHPDELEKFGVTDHLREFVRSLSVATLRDFPLQDDVLVSDVPTVANVRQDLTVWQG